MGKIGHLIYQEKIVDSTQFLAASLASEGAEEGVVVSANIQTAGRGQKKRTWYTGEGDNIAMSIILKPHLLPHECPQITLLAAVAVVQAIEEVTSLKPTIKWPNDILINEKKLVGILTEMKISQNELQHIILGIGMNVNVSLELLDKEIRHIATSISIETGNQFDKINLMKVIFDKLEILYRQFLENGFTAIKPLWEKYATIVRNEVIANVNGIQIEGKATGISNNGILLIEDNMGKIHELYSADISMKSAQK